MNIVLQLILLLPSKKEKIKKTKLPDFISKLVHANPSPFEKKTGQHERGGPGPSPVSVTSQLLLPFIPFEINDKKEANSAGRDQGRRRRSGGFLLLLLISFVFSFLFQVAGQYFS